MDNQVNHTEPAKPLITFGLCAYNQENYIEDAIKGAFAQTYSPLEIIISDDCSADKTFEIMQRMVNEYKGPHKIILNRNEQNLGIAKHFNKVIQLSHGEYWVCAAGDDISFPERTERSYQIFKKYPNVNAMSFADITIDENFRLSSDWESKCSQYYLDNPKTNVFSLKEFYIDMRMLHSGSSRTFSRKLYDQFGPISEDSAEEDTVLAMRSILLGESLSVGEKLVLHRIDGNNLSLKISRNLDLILSEIDARCAEVEKAKKQNIISLKDYKKIIRLLNDQKRARKFFFKHFHAIRPYRQENGPNLRRLCYTLSLFILLPIKWPAKRWFLNIYYVLFKEILFSKKK